MRLGSMTLEPLKLGPILRLQLTLVGEGIVCLGTYIMTVAYIRKILMELIGLNLRQNVISDIESEIAVDDNDFKSIIDIRFYAIFLTLSKKY